MAMIKVEPAGAQYGTVWDEKGRDKVAGIYVFYKEYKVVALEFVFYENGKLVKSNRHGDVDKYANYTAVMFDYPLEYLTSVTGSMCTRQVFRSITFVTNKTSYGPFGTLMGFKQFNFQIPRGSFGGLFGTTKRDGIESLGVYVKINKPSPNYGRIVG